jgi:hypothetical protein
MSWINEEPDVLYSNLRIVDEFSPVKEKLYTDTEYRVSEFDTRITLQWQLRVATYVSERDISHGALEEAKQMGRRLLRAEIYKDVRVELERLYHSLSGRDLATSLKHLHKLMDITRP